MTLKTETPYTVGPISAHSGVRIGWQVWRKSILGCGAPIWQIAKPGADGLAAAQDECDRLNTRDGFPLQPRTPFQRSFIYFKGSKIVPVGETQWQAGINRPVRDTLAEAKLDIGR